MQRRQKRIMAINDISCFGKCSLTVALPILSSVGFEVCPVPTALLSTHTGGFSGYTFKNLEDQITPITEHWKKEKISFDAIYSGYLGSFEQLELIKKIIADFSEKGTMVLVDPVMGDNGKLYAGFSAEFSEGMFELCKSADIIVPNITEACYMLKKEYKAIYSESEIKDFFAAFERAGIEKAVITGIHTDENSVVCAVCENGEVSFVKNKKIDGMYHGTGDVFASALLAAVLSGKSLFDAAKSAAEFVLSSIEITQKRYGNSHYGVDFEESVAAFATEIKD